MAFEQLAHWQVYDDVGRRKYLTEDERRRFLSAADGLDQDERALCYVLVFAGCRVSEALALRRHQQDAARLALVVRTLKRRKVIFRTIPLPDSVVAMLLSMPPREDGRFWTMHRTTAWRAVKRAMGIAAIAGPMACCKGLRHGFGMHAANTKVPPNLIQRWMGHSSPTTTAVYLDAIGNEEREFAERMW